MALDEADMAVIDGILANCDHGALGTAASALRQRLPGLAVMACDAADVLETPWRRYAALDLHLVNSSSHCAAMTDNPAAATGLLLAQRAEAA